MVMDADHGTGRPDVTVSARPVAGPAAEPRLPGGVHVDPAGQIAFLQRHYLGAEQGFVREGGAKLKLVIGGTGAGKTHLLTTLLALARAEGFLAVHVDAGTQPLWGFDHLYRAVVVDLDLAALARLFGARLLAHLGYHDATLAPGETLAAWAAAGGHDLGRLRVRLDEALHAALVDNPDIDYGYALGLERWCAAVLWGGWGGEARAGAGTEPARPEAGTAAGEAAVALDATVVVARPAPAIGGGPDPAAEGGLLEHWLRGGKVAVRDCNRLRVRRSVERFTGRLWLRSLLYFIRLAGLPGLVVAVDGMGVVLAKRRQKGEASAAPAAGTWGDFVQGSGDRLHYTRLRLDDLYESLRTIVDDMGLLPGFTLLLAGPPALLTDTRTGIASYEALRTRLQNEVETVEINRFADQISLERLWAADPDAGRTLAERLIASVAPGADAQARRDAVAAAKAQWGARDVTVSAVRRSVLAVLAVARGHGTGTA